ncbi:MAG: putative zinc-binding metallopeptidase, partial [Cellvibrio sp.]
ILGFLAENLEMESFKVTEEGLLQLVDGDDSRLYKYCANGINYNVCNWVVQAAETHDLCIACRLNRTIPDLNVPKNRELWARVETEKRRLIYSLLVLNLPLAPESIDAPKLAFDFLAEETTHECQQVMTGHANGLITLNINEADSATREKVREQMAEPYRTLLGHFRHESGHYYWDLLVRNSEWLGSLRELFGDDSEDYSDALKNYYENGPALDWQQNYVSAYASSHPWEDWAETWAHYLHITDTLETAHEFGIKVSPQVSNSKELQTNVGINVYDSKNFSNILRHWLPLSYALNSLSRSIGHQHAYPFVLTEPVIKKLDLVHRIIQKGYQEGLVSG